MTEKKSKKTAFVLPTVKDLLEAGAHFGHETKRWNPKFNEFIYTKRGGFHIIDLDKTLEQLDKAYKFLHGVASKGGDIVIVGTKRQARDIVQEESVRCGAHFVINRWVGGLVTNYETIGKGIEKLRAAEEELSGDIDEYTPYQLSVLRREWGRLDRLYGGVKQLKKRPDAVIVVDAHYEKIAVSEALQAGIPVVAIVDSNTDFTGIDYPIPANDDAIKALQLIMKSFGDAILAGNNGKGIKHDFIDYSRVGVKESDLTDEQKKELEKKDAAVAEGKEEKKVAKKETKSDEQRAVSKKPKAKSSKPLTAQAGKAQKKTTKKTKKVTKAKKKVTKKAVKTAAPKKKKTTTKKKTTAKKTTAKKTTKK